MVTTSIKGILTICKWTKHLIALTFVKSSITINKMAKMLIKLNSIKQLRFRNLSKFFPIVLMKISSSDLDLAHKL